MTEREQIYDLFILTFSLFGEKIDSKTANSMTDELLNNEDFKSLKYNDYKAIMRNGTTGKYGKVYRISFHEICTWVRAYQVDEGKIVFKYRK